MNHFDSNKDNLTYYFEEETSMENTSHDKTPLNFFFAWWFFFKWPNIQS